MVSDGPSHPLPWSRQVLRRALEGLARAFQAFGKVLERRPWNALETSAAYDLGGFYKVMAGLTRPWDVWARLGNPWKRMEFLGGPWKDLELVAPPWKVLGILPWQKHWGTPWRALGSRAPHKPLPPSLPPALVARLAPCRGNDPTDPNAHPVSVLLLFWRLVFRHACPTPKDAFSTCSPHAPTTMGATPTQGVTATLGVVATPGVAVTREVAGARGVAETQGRAARCGIAATYWVAAPTRMASPL